MNEISWIENENPISEELFGRDHWSTLAYLETRIVDHKGAIEHDHMRCSAKRHPFLVNAGKRSGVIGGSDGSKYPTRIKVATEMDWVWGVKEVFDHDDYDCVADLIGAGLVEVTMPQPNSSGVYVDHRGEPIWMGDDLIHDGMVTGIGEAYLQAKATFKLTDRGEAVAGRLRAWCGRGGNYHNFVVEREIVADRS